MERMQQDPIWMNRVKKEQELRVKFGFPPVPIQADYPDYASWHVAYMKDFNTFMEVTGMNERQQAILALYWSDAFNAGVLQTNQLGLSTDLHQISVEMNFEFGDCTIEDVVSEYRRRIAH